LGKLVLKHVGVWHDQRRQAGTAVADDHRLQDQRIFGEQ
jgi:hypothetical protein